MASAKLNNPKFTWGDSVLVSESYSDRYPLGKIGSICGISEIKNQVMQNKYNQLLGTFIYTVEFNSGESELIPECYLRGVQSN